MSDSRYLVNRTFTQKDTKLQYIANTLYPDVPVSEDDWYVITTMGDRFDLLSQQFYSTSEYWWLIAIANGCAADTMCPEVGVQIRIPANPADYIEKLERENR